MIHISEYFKPIRNEQDTTDIIELSSILLHILTGLLTVISLAAFVTGNHAHLLSTAIIFGFTGWLIKKHRSRAAASVLCGYNCLNAINALLMLTSMHTGIINALLWVPSAIISIRALQAARKYHRIKQTRLNYNNAMAQTLLAFIYSIIFLMIAAALLGYTGLLRKFDTAGNATLMVIILILGYGLTFKGLLPFSKDRPVTSVQQTDQSPT